MRYTKYKNLIKVTLFGKNDIWLTNSDSLYKINGNFTNCKRCRFNLNGMLNDILLSKNARLVLESSYIPTITEGYYNLQEEMDNIVISNTTQDIEFLTISNALSTATTNITALGVLAATANTNALLAMDLANN